MVRIPTSQVRHELAEILNRVAYQGERVVLKRNGRDVAALISLDDLKRLEEIEDRLDYEAGEKSRSRMKARRQKPIAWERVKRKLKLR
jgi:prevent-host-death family protein